ncbi:LysR family transcriptional regulator [Brucella sp. NM4]|uniref:LysR family transcriptional regulator n=1 Tax=Brucella/Ochrobactrum group TaxID=2826938 RepID=UPI0024BC1511|nr:LysR family transcriptional regulator [Brucella sp. NM4]WHS33295.1 LysR family transcriptional regulator [Brucella sp. NM4]WHT43397.1 LysR family transcriptional regulator [Ochrobactrum sp. SSR]
MCPQPINAKELFNVIRKFNGTMNSRAGRRRLPSLKALRAFEAVAHCQSFTAAAEELAVSQGAVSHQIKLLEQALGCQLLIRGPRGVTVTAEGALLAEVCGRALDEIGAVTALIGQDNRAQILRVRAGPFFSMEVIASRIAGFLKQNPGIQLHLNNLEIDSIAHDREDAQIKYCLNAPAGAYSIDLLTEKLVPVCSPSLLEGVANPEDLLTNPDIPRLHYRDMSDWKRWISHHGIGDIAANSNLFFDDQHTLLAAARSGQGIGFSHRPLLESDVQRGSLGIVSEKFFQPKESYKFICSHETIALNHALQLFRDWLMAEVSTIC